MQTKGDLNVSTY